MKLNAVQVYVAVEFGPRRTKYNYFSERNELTGVEMELLSKEGVVSIKQSDYHILIPLANVAHMVPDSTEGRKVDVKSREAKLGEAVREAGHPKFAKG